MQLRFDLLFSPLYNNKAIQAKSLNEISLTISYETTVSKTSLTQKIMELQNKTVSSGNCR
jgi:hypothetical protein